jgi:hypothetical protein
VNDDTKRCGKCGLVKPLGEFYVLRNGKTRTPCKECVRTAHRLHHRATQLARLREGAGPVWRDHGLAPEDYPALVAQQGGKCAACGEKPGRRRRLHVDHNPLTGQVRGLVCQPCRLVLASAREVVARLAACAAYLAEHRAVREEAPPDWARIL